MSKEKIIIIGAGLTGLATAYFLKKQNKEFLILEKSSKAGGAIQTNCKDGFVYEEGPNTGVISNIETLELINDIKKFISIDFAQKESKKRYILKQNQYHELPSGLISAIKTPLFSCRDKINILGEPFRKPSQNESESVAEMVTRRLGKSFLDYAVDPFISGIYAGDPNYLCTKYALPKLYNLEQKYGSFIKGTIKKRKEPKSDIENEVKRDIFSAIGGLGAIIKVLVDIIGENNIIYNALDTKINTSNGLYNITYLHNNEENIIQCEKVIITSNAKSLNSLLPFISAKDLTYSNSLQYARVIQVALGFKNWNSKSYNGFGVLYPRVENEDLLGILFMSSFLKQRCPIHGKLFSVFMGGFSRPDILELSNDMLYEIIERNFKKHFEIDKFSPDLFEIYRHHSAIPQYGSDTGKRIEEINSIMQKHEGLIIGGNAIGGIAIADRIAQASKLCNKAVQ